MAENIRQDVIRLLGEIAPKWSQKMNEYVDTVDRLGRMEADKTRQITKRHWAGSGPYQADDLARICQTDSVRCPNAHRPKLDRIRKTDLRQI
ncbi:hypothetical protein KUCAC02_012568 [Chaenocephalus aceratus]|uniref:Uncharacterized protein n=1 Tax=Chaenocephalus aceratus TaxID=36190 RepID=A0ACB9XC46_CHAAC|nr:hypothetical protein KUCAC02_012568 [Chaenocephalus aceratus]